MEESDAILLPILRDAGCSIKETITSVAEFDSDLFYHCCATSLQLINQANNQSNNQTIASSLPAGKAARFRLTSALSESIKESGYPNEIGYQHFLYPAENDMRKLLRWIIDKLPKAEGDIDSLNQTSATSVNQSVSDAGAAARARIRSGIAHFNITPFQSVKYASFHTTRLSLPDRSAPEACQNYYNTRLHTIAAQIPPNKSLAASIIAFNSLHVALAADHDTLFGQSANEIAAKRKAALQERIDRAFQQERKKPVLTTRKPWNEYALAPAGSHAFNLDGSVFARRTQFENDTSNVSVAVVSSAGALNTVSSINQQGQTEAEAADQAERLRLEREAELQKLNDAYMESSQRLTSIGNEVDVMDSEAKQLETSLLELNQTVAELEEAYTIKKRTLGLLPNAEQNERELRQTIEATRARIMQMATEWETARQALLGRLHRAQAKFADRKSEALRKADQIARMRAELKQSAESIRTKDDQIAAAKAELEAQGSGPSRASFIRRITDIIRNLDKQKAAIAAILEDLRRVQRDINTINEASSRSFAIADEMLFREAKTASTPQPNAPAGLSLEIKAYKQLMDLRDTFVDLVKQIESIGKIEAENRAHTALIEQLEKRSASMNADRVQQDLAAVRKENKQLREKLGS